MVNQAIQLARKRARQKIESLYDGTFTVYHFTESYDAKKHRTVTTKEKLIADAPCRVSISSVSPSTSTDTVATKVQTITLYCAPEQVIPAGCEITVTQAGVTSAYKASGQPRIYPTHQETSLTLSEDKA